MNSVSQLQPPVSNTKMICGTEEVFLRIINLAREDVKGIEPMGLKLMEEVGELAECINFAQGYLPHKQMKEPLIGEAADVIQNVLAILAKAYPDWTQSEIIRGLDNHLQKKTDKWESVMVKKSKGKEFLFSYTVADDEKLAALGHEFIGAGVDVHGHEVHLFTKETT